MQISSNGLQFIKNEECSKDAEGNIICPLQAYAATPNEAKNNIYTIAYGDTHLIDGTPVKKDTKITQQQADDLWSFRISKFESSLQPLLPMPLTQNQYDAIVSLTYNIGLNAFANSTLLKDLHLGSYTKAGNDFLEWIYQNHKVLPGLVNRRNRESALYFSDDTPQSIKDLMSSSDIQET